VLFIEKEGFAPLFKAAQIAERFDVAIMSTKGMSVVAARALVDEMCFDHEVPLLLLHDFDKAGFSIAGTLQRDTRRYEFQNAIQIIDLGLSLADVEQMASQRAKASVRPPYEGYAAASRRPGRRRRTNRTSAASATAVTSAKIACRS
jgi:DNA topoisomerase VI subunit A